ncbi:NAD-dependent epimerase [Pontibacter rugosus]
MDSLNSYYDPALKYRRLELQGFCQESIKPNQLLTSTSAFNSSFVQLDLVNAEALQHLFASQRFDVVINLAAQAGVRHSLEHPEQYVSSNLVGFANLLECVRRHTIQHFLFASSSSVYGLNKEIPFQTDQQTDAPVSFYAATKKANEAMAHSYAHLYGIPTTGLRFFTVYGPWGRPDMAYYSFAKAIAAGTPIQLFNHGDMLRDFTYVSDVVESILRLLKSAPQIATSSAPYKLYNIGNNKPVQLLEMVNTLERLLDQRAILDLKPMQPGDVKVTFANVDELIKATGYSPNTSLQQGLAAFVTWFKAYHQLEEQILQIAS